MNPDIIDYWKKERRESFKNKKTLRGRHKIYNDDISSAKQLLSLTTRFRDIISKEVESSTFRSLVLDDMCEITQKLKKHIARNEMFSFKDEARRGFVPEMLDFVSMTASQKIDEKIALEQINKIVSQEREEREASVPMHETENALEHVDRLISQEENFQEQIPVEENLPAEENPQEQIPVDKGIFNFAEHIQEHMPADFLEVNSWFNFAYENQDYRHYEDPNFYCDEIFDPNIFCADNASTSTATNGWIQQPDTE